MSITKIQDEPFAAWAASADTTVDDVRAFLETDLPAAMILEWRGRSIVFQTEVDRRFFICGLACALENE